MNEISNELVTSQENVTTSENNYDEYFTPTTSGLNGEFNNLNIGCLTSKNNKFNLDNEGNLTVNSLTTVVNNQSLNIDQIYPVGSIYMNIQDVDPSLLFGGNWEKLENRFLIGASNDYGLGTTGGNATHAHVLNHKHSRGTLTAPIMIDSTYIWSKWSTDTTGAHAVVSWTGNARKPVSGSNAVKTFTEDEGSPVYGQTGDATNNTTTTESSVPPYLAVNIWKRTN